MTLYFMAGNDDLYSIDKVVEEFEHIRNPDMKCFEMEGGYSVVGLSNANMTPWRCARDIEEPELAAERLRKSERSRFGPTFGSAVHRALELLVAQCVDQVEVAVSLAAQEAGLTEHLAEAEADIRRALAALRQLGVLDNSAVSVTTEYPLAMQWNDGKLLSGYLDLLAVSPERVTVIDYKTDAPQAGPLPTAYPEYAAQLRLYGDLLRTAGVVGTRALELGLLLTASGELRWL